MLNNVWCVTCSRVTSSYKVIASAVTARWLGSSREVDPWPRQIPEVGMKFKIEIEREDDGRWIAEVPELPGVMAYGATPEEARAKVQALALRVVADRLENVF